jgi:hypothetical protein
MAIEPKPSKTRKFKEWLEAGMPTFQHFKTKEEKNKYLKWLEKNQKQLPF